MADRVLEGGEVRLRPLAEKDVPLLARWLCDPDVLHRLQLSEDPPQLRFVREGQLRRPRLRHGRPVDMVVIGTLEEEYREANDRLGE